MFDILFGWRKASKCKKLITHVQCRLKLLKNKRYSIVRQLREDAAQLLKIGHEQSALNREFNWQQCYISQNVSRMNPSLVEQLYKDESIMAVYELLDHFCEFIIIHLSYIRRHKDCPNDINEAVSSLIFASARCGDLPELRTIRKLFGERYGHEFATRAVELFPGNLVNRQIKEKLSVKSVPDEVKHRLIDEIFRDYCRQPGPLALEYSSEWQQQQQVKENGRYGVPDRDLQSHCDRTAEGSQIQDSNVIEMERKAIVVNSSLNTKKFLIEECRVHGDYDIISTSPIVLDSQIHKKAEKKMDTYALLDSPYKLAVSGLSTIINRGSRRIYAAPMGNKEDKMAAPSSSESSLQFPEFPEETIVCLDDIEEFQSPLSKEGNWQDQRLFMFKSSGPPKVEDHRNEDYIEKSGSWIENADLRSSRKDGKRLRKPSVSRENQSVKDVGCVIYYGRSCRSPSNQNYGSHHHRKNSKKIRIEEVQKSNDAMKTPNFVGFESNIQSSKCSCSCSLKCELDTDCSLEHPCYFCISDERVKLGISPWKENRRITTLGALPKHDLDQEKLQNSLCDCSCFQDKEPTNQEKEWALTFPNYKPKKQSKTTEKEAEGANYMGSFVCSNNGSCSTRKDTESPYLRAWTMPPERRKDSCSDNFVRSNSCPFEQPNQLNHVHPKLPDYDELAAKFMALKQAYQQNKQH